MNLLTGAISHSSIFFVSNKMGQCSEGGGRCARGVNSPPEERERDVLLQNFAIIPIIVSYFQKMCICGQPELTLPYWHWYQ